MKNKQKIVAIQPAKPAGALPPPLVAAMFAQAGVALRAGRPETVSMTLGPAAARFRAVARRLAFESEPGLFPAVIAKPAKTGKKKVRK